MLRHLKYPYIDNENEDEVKDGCGAIVNLMAGQFKKEMSSLGYEDVEMSHFKSYINTAIDCVKFPPEQSYKYEISFEIEDKKRMVMEVILAMKTPVVDDQKSDAPPVPSSGSRKKILVVDDDMTLIKVIQPLLSTHGFDVAVATDGEEGIKYLMKNKPDLILLDVHMPRMNGYTFLLEIKKVPYLKYTPVIILTAKEGMVEIFKIEGVKEYILKPFQPEMLLEHIKKYV
jgi:two-component system chemotaxis response regulator CheY